MAEMFTIEMFAPGFPHGYTVFVGADEAFATGVFRRMNEPNQPPSGVRYELVRWLYGNRVKPTEPETPETPATPAETAA